MNAPNKNHYLEYLESRSDEAIEQITLKLQAGRITKEFLFARLETEASGIGCPLNRELVEDDFGYSEVSDADIDALINKYRFTTKL